MNNLQIQITIERYACAARHGKLYFSLDFDPFYNPDNPTPGHTPHRVQSCDLELIAAAGMCRHWATGLIRLKFGLDPTTYRPALSQFQRLAMDTGNRLEWDDPELTAFLAEEALHGWLLDRQFHGKDADWRNRCVTLRKLLNRELHDAAVAIQHCL